MKREDTLKLYRNKLEDLDANFRIRPPRTVDLFTDKYFDNAARILEHHDHDRVVTMQVFTKKPAVVCGTAEAVNILKAYTDDVEIKTLVDGDKVSPWETVMLLRGKYSKLARLETVVLGVLARRTKIATNAHNLTKLTDKPILYMGARHDDWRVQAVDGFAAYIGGMKLNSTLAGSWDREPVGTMPHALIACYRGDIPEATLRYCLWHINTNQPEAKLISLVDYNNNCVRDAVAVADRIRDTLGDVLWGVRLDTSEQLVDEGIKHLLLKNGNAGNVNYTTGVPRNRLTGVNPHLVHAVRDALDEAGHERIKIVVSGGFNAKKITLFEKSGVPVDAYGVGSSVLEGKYDYTADIVEVDGEPEAKVGRGIKPNERLIQL